jgi:V/A-type H+-transporting ATPase subunit F
MKQIAFITPPDVEYGFKLSGVAHLVTETDEAKDTLKKTMNEPDYGLLIIDERLIDGITEERLRELEQAWNGILLVLPSPEKPPAEVEDYAARLIRRAIGYHVRLKV